MDSPYNEVQVHVMVPGIRMAPYFLIVGKSNNPEGAALKIAKRIETLLIDEFQPDELSNIQTFVKSHR